jgi:hypothetical protein
MIGYLHEHDRARFFRLWSKRAFLRRGALANVTITGTVRL